MTILGKKKKKKKITILWEIKKKKQENDHFGERKKKMTILGLLQGQLSYKKTIFEEKKKKINKQTNKHL